MIAIMQDTHILGGRSINNTYVLNVYSLPKTGLIIQGWGFRLIFKVWLNRLIIQGIVFAIKMLKQVIKKNLIGRLILCGVFSLNKLGGHWLTR